MSNFKIIGSEAISNSQVYELIKENSENRELTYREEKTLEFLKNRVKLSAKDFLKAKEELKALEIPRLEDKHIVKILEILPRSGTELRAIVSHSGTVLVDESVAKIIDVLKKYQ